MKKTLSPCHKSWMIIHSKKPLRYRCKICEKTFVARHGEISFGSKLTPQEVLELLALLRQGLSIRHIAKNTALSASTVLRWKQRFSQQKLLHTLTPQHHECF